MYTVITVYVDLRDNFVRWECTWMHDNASRCHENRTCLSFTTSLHALHFTALCCRYPHSTAPCRAWSGFFTTVWQGLQFSHLVATWTRLAGNLHKSIYNFFVEKLTLAHFWLNCLDKSFCYCRVKLWSHFYSL